MGSLTAVEECADARRVNVVAEIRQDSRYALRAMARSPGFSAIAILTLALGIGATTAIFSVINAVLLRPLPFPAADRLVTIIENRPASEPFDGRPARRPPLPDDIRELQSQARTLEAVYLYGGAPDIRLPGHENAPPLRGARMEGPAMASLGARPELGRLPQADEQAALVLSAQTWRRYFNEDRSVIGRTLATTVGNVPSLRETQVYTIVGVVAQGFAFPEAGIDYWLSGAGPLNVARLADGISRGAAAEEISAVLHRVIGKAPLPASEQGPPRFEVVPLQEQMVGRVRPILRLFGLTVAVVLFIACANVANLLLARSATRTREAAIRVALGASRGRLIRQTLTESVVLAGMGGLIGTLLAFGGVRLLRTLLANLAAPATIRQVGAAAGPSAFPRIAEIQLDVTTFLFASAVCLMTGLLFGLTPALRQTRAGLAVLRDGTASAVSGFALFGRNAVRSTLVIAQVSLAMTLLVAGGLIIHSLWQLLTVNKGFDPSNVLTFEVHHRQGSRSVQDLKAFAEELMRRLQATPGVVSAAYSHGMPLMGPVQRTPLLLDPGERVPESKGPDSSTSPALRLVSGDFFSVTGTRIVAGRGFGTLPGGPPRAIVINETLARRQFGDDNPIGRHVYLALRLVASEPFEIVGIVEDIRQQGLDVEPEPEMFLDFRTWPGARPAADEPNYYAVRTAVEPRLMLEQIQNAVAMADPRASIQQALTLEDVVSDTVARPRAYAILLGIFAGVGLILATIGVYGVMTCAVAQSTRELGVRLALGAQRREILRFVLGRAGMMTGLGITIGLGGAFAVTRYLRAILFGLSPLDPGTFVASALLFSTVAMLASYVPARRAMRVDPLVALRYE